MKFILNEKNTPQGIVLTVTDLNIIGKKIEERNRQLDLSNQFYQGSEKSELEVRARAECAHIIHFTGKEAVALGKRWGLIEEKRILKVKNVPHAEVIIEEGN